MIFNMAGGGSGTILNFEVVGSTTAPASPKENTIWVNTDVAITNWMFSSTEPENLTDNMVWFCTVTSSNVQFNSIKKNEFMVYIQHSKQYISGSWANKETYIYQNGAWIELWDGILYRNGNTYDDVTGGWESVSDCYWGNATLQSNKMYMECGNSNSGKWWNERGFRTKNLIDLSNFSILYAKGTCNSGGIFGNGQVGGLKCCIRPDGGTESENVANYVVNTSNTTFNAVIDVSNLNGLYRIYTLAYCWGDTEYMQGKGEITEVYLV